MANLTITESEVQPTNSTTRMRKVAGEDVDAGEVVYLKSADDKLWLAQCDDTEAVAVARGIALHAAKAGQPLEIQTAGLCTIGASAAMTVGEIYVLSETAGKIAPEGDITTTGRYVTSLGVATAAGVLNLNIHASGAQIP